MNSKPMIRYNVSISFFKIHDNIPISYLNQPYVRSLEMRDLFDKYNRFVEKGEYKSSFSDFISEVLRHARPSPNNV